MMSGFGAAPEAWIGAGKHVAEAADDLKRGVDAFCRAVGGYPFGSDDLGRALFAGDPGTGAPGFAGLRDGLLEDLAWTVNLLRGMGAGLIVAGGMYRETDGTIVEDLGGRPGSVDDASPRWLRVPESYVLPQVPGGLPSSAPAPDIWVQAEKVLGWMGVPCQWPEGDLFDPLGDQRDAARSMRGVLEYVAEEVAGHARRVTDHGFGAATDAFASTARVVYGEAGLLKSLAARCEDLAHYCEQSRSAVIKARLQCVATATYVVGLMFAAATIGGWAEGLVAPLIKLEGEALQIVLWVIRNEVLGMSFTVGVDGIDQLFRWDGFHAGELAGQLLERLLVSGFVGAVTHAVLPALLERPPALAWVSRWSRSSGPRGLAIRYVLSGGIGTTAIWAADGITGHGWNLHNLRDAAETGFGMALTGTGTELACKILRTGGPVRAGASPSAGQTPPPVLEAATAQTERSDATLIVPGARTSEAPTGGARSPRPLTPQTRHQDLTDVLNGKPSKSPPKSGSATETPVNNYSGSAGDLGGPPGDRRPLPDAYKQVQALSRSHHHDPAVDKTGCAKLDVARESGAIQAISVDYGHHHTTHSSQEGATLIGDQLDRMAQIEPRSVRWYSGLREDTHLHSRGVELYLASRINRLEEVFSLDSTEHPFPGMTLHFTGRGNEQLVYTPLEYPDVVIKIHHYHLKLAFQDLSPTVRSRLLSGSTPEYWRQLHDSIERSSMREAKRLAFMRSIYGDGHSIPLRCRTVSFPFPGRVLYELGFGEYLSERQIALPAPILVQPRLDTSRGMDLSIGPGRTKEAFRAEDVNEANRRWVGLNSPNHFSKNLFQRIHPDNSMVRLLEVSSNDPALRQTVREFTKKTIEYIQESREFVALRGRFNIFFERQGSSWNYHLLDALGQPQEANSLDDSINLLRRIRNGERLPLSDRAKVGAGVAYIQSLNALALEMGLHDLLELPSEFKSYPWDLFFDRGMPTIRSY